MSSKCILIVKDKISNVTSDLKCILEDIGFQIQLCSSSRLDFIEYRRRYDPDLLLLDMKLINELDTNDEVKFPVFHWSIPQIYHVDILHNENLGGKNIEPSEELFILSLWKRKLMHSITLAFNSTKKKNIQSNEESICHDSPLIPEFVFSVNDEGHITFWSESLSNATGFSDKETYGKSIKELSVFRKVDEIDAIIESVRSTFLEDPSMRLLLLNNKHGGVTAMHLFFPPELIVHDEKKFFIFVGWDVSQLYDLVSSLNVGMNYIIHKDEDHWVLGLVSSLLSFDFHVMYITRKSLLFIMRLFNNTCSQFLLLGEKDVGIPHCIINVDELITYIKNFCLGHSKAVILLDRLDYFLNRFSFSGLMKMLYIINDIIFGTSSMFLLVSDLSIFNERQERQLRTEFTVTHTWEPSDVVLDECLMKWLFFIQSKGHDEAGVSFSVMKDWFDVTYPTVRMRIKRLQMNGLIKVRKNGRNKIVRLSKRGKDFVRYYQD